MRVLSVREVSKACFHYLSCRIKKKIVNIFIRLESLLNIHHSQPEQAYNTRPEIYGLRLIKNNLKNMLYNIWVATKK